MNVETFGNYQLGPGTREQPRASLLLLAYNQEGYIEQAIEGAFAQTYSPLEIILSDDCSPDDATFVVMERLAKAYVGPHKVLLVRQSRNLGLIAHVNQLLELASADIMVLAAGDDICMPQRVERLVRAFRNDPAAMVVHSDAIAIDDAGTPGTLVQPPVHADANPVALATAPAIYIGATGAVRREVIRKFGPITQVRTFEDLVMGFRAALLDGLRYIPEPLLQYRTNVGISSAGLRQASFACGRLRHAEIMLATLRQRYADLMTIGGPNHHEIAMLITNEIAHQNRIKAFHEATTEKSRVAYLGKVLRYGRTGMFEALRQFRYFFQISRGR